MNVSLTPELEAFINEQVASGRYRSASEAVRASIRLLLDRTAEREAKLRALRNAVDRGVGQLDRGEAVDGNRVFEEVLNELTSLPMSRTDRSQWTTKVSRLEDAKGADDYWMGMTPEERMSFAWELSLSAWKLAHPDYEDEPGLPRSVARVVRGGS